MGQCLDNFLWNRGRMVEDAEDALEKIAPPICALEEY